MGQNNEGWNGFKITYWCSEKNYLMFCQKLLDVLRKRSWCFFWHHLMVFFHLKNISTNGIFKTTIQVQQFAAAFCEFCHNWKPHKMLYCAANWKSQFEFWNETRIIRIVFLCEIPGVSGKELITIEILKYIRMKRVPRIRDEFHLMQLKNKQF